MNDMMRHARDKSSSFFVLFGGEVGDLGLLPGILPRYYKQTSLYVYSNDLLLSPRLKRRFALTPGHATVAPIPK